MPSASLPSGIDIEYESFGDPGDPTLLAVSGFNSQLLSWPDAFIALLVDAGLHVVRFDNRDVGLSSRLHGVRVAPTQVLQAVASGAEVPEVPYTLHEMAADAVGLLDHLAVDHAHVAGKSMGGMIVQIMAIDHPDRVASLTSIMSRPGDGSVGAATDEARAALLAPPPPNREAAIEASLSAAVWCSKRHFDPEAARDLAARAFDRAHYPEGATRQLAAIYATPDWSEALRGVDAPTLVIHGLDDTLITPEGGVATADLVPGARLELFADMGHDMPEPLWPRYVELLAEQCGLTVRG